MPSFLADLTPDEWRAVALSLRVSTTATLLSLPLGIAVAYVLARYDFWGKPVLSGVVRLRLGLPPVGRGCGRRSGCGRSRWRRRSAASCTCR